MLGLRGDRGVGERRASVTGWDLVEDWRREEGFLRSFRLTHLFDILCNTRYQAWPWCEMDDFFDNWTVQVRKGVLELCILTALADQERYGYDLVKSLVAIPGLGVTEGTLYPLLSRLKTAGLMTSRLEESSSGPARKYYALTAEGRQVLGMMNDHWNQLNQGVARLREEGV